jgi:glycerophosphoryl diester phosphodiesterase
MIPYFFVLCTIATLLNMTTSYAFEIQGHRGARARLPENSIPAFIYAYEIGVDVIELDLVVSKDRVLVVNHDLRINPQLCLDKLGKSIPSPGPLVFLLNWSEIKSFDCGSKPNPRFPDQKLIPGTRITRLSDVFTTLDILEKKSKRPIRFNIETKIDPRKRDESPSPEEFAQILYDMLVKFNKLKSATVQSFDERTLIAIKKIDPEVKTVILNENPWNNSIQQALRIGASVVSPYFKFVSKKYVDRAHKNGLQVIPWTPNTESEWKKLMSLEVDGIITDDPESLQKLQRGMKK